MPVRCPKCKFESPDDAAWCDFCKEPFRKAAASGREPSQPASGNPLPAGAPKTPEPATAADPAAALEALRKADSVLKAGDGEKLPTIPAWFRALAWLFLGVWLMTGMMLAGMMFARRREARQPASTDVETMSRVVETPAP